jgi:hypothetical protein
MSGQLHDQVALPPVPTGQEAGCLLNKLTQRHGVELGSNFRNRVNITEVLLDSRAVMNVLVKIKFPSPTEN